MTRRDIDGKAVRLGLTALLLSASLLLCVYGIWRNGLFTRSAWTDPGASLYVAAGMATALLLLDMLARRANRAGSFVAAAGALVLAACFAGLGATAAALLQLISGFCIGRRLYPTSVDDEGGLAYPVIATAAGLAALSLVVGALSFFPLNTPTTYLLLLALPIAWGWRGNVSAILGVLQAWARRAPGASRGWILVLHGIVAFALFLRLLAVLHPELGADALAMHLVIAEQLRLHARFHYDVTQSIWALMPMAGDWQFAIANMLEGQHAARLVNFAIDTMIVVLVHEYASRSWSRLAGAAAAALYASTPLLYLETTSLFIENPWTLWCAAAMLVAQRSTRTQDPRDAIAAGFLLGTALAAKVITLFLAPFFFVIAAAWLRSRALGLRLLAAFASAATITASLPYANAWLRSDNPVFPFMNHVFKSPYYDATSPFGNVLFSQHARWDTLYQVTFHTGNYLEALPGAVGIAFLVFLPAAIGFALSGSWRLRWTALCALLFVVLVFRFQAYLRYVLPALPVFAVLTGATVDGLVTGRSALVRTTVLSVVAACALAGLYLTPSATFLHRAISMPLHAGSEAEERYLARNRPEQTLARVIDAMQFERVLWIGSPYYAGSDSDVFTTNWHGGYAQGAEFLALDSVGAMQRWVARRRFHAIALAADANACARPFVCDFLAKKARKVYEDGPVALYAPNADVLFGQELLRNGGFDRGIEGWDGTAAYAAADGAVEVTAQAPLVQAVRVVSGESYALEVEGRCTPQGGSFRAQVNWLDASGKFIAPDISVFECSPDFVSHASVVTAPTDAATAVVYASGHLPDKSAEITRVSFRQ